VLHRKALQLLRQESAVARVLPKGGDLKICRADLDTSFDGGMPGRNGETPLVDLEKIHEEMVGRSVSSSKYMVNPNPNNPKPHFAGISFGGNRFPDFNS
jgi:hypothetical protein